MTSGRAHAYKITVSGLSLYTLTDSMYSNALMFLSILIYLYLLLAP